MLRRLREGAKGEDVRRWQAFLKQANFDPGALDGDFGPRTGRRPRTISRPTDLLRTVIVNS